MAEQRDLDGTALVPDRKTPSSPAHLHEEPNQQDNKIDEKEDSLCLSPNEQCNDEDDETGDHAEGDDQADKKRYSADSIFSAWSYDDLLAQDIEKDETFHSPPQSPEPSLLPTQTSHPALVAYQHNRVYIASFQDLQAEARDSLELRQIVDVIEDKGWISAFDKAVSDLDVSSGFESDGKAWTVPTFMSWWYDFNGCMDDVARELRGGKDAHSAARPGSDGGSDGASQDEKPSEALSSPVREKVAAPESADHWRDHHA